MLTYLIDGRAKTIQARTIHDGMVILKRFYPGCNYPGCKIEYIGKGE